MRGKQVTSGKWRVARETLRRWAIRTLHRIVTRLDDWCYAQEASWRPEAGGSKLEIDPTVNRAESAVREREHRRANQAPLPRLRYDHGKWVAPVTSH